MTLRLQAVRVRTASDDQDGQMVFADDALVAVLVHLAPSHGTLAGHWFLEAGFGRLICPIPPTFAALDEALAWIARQLEAPH